MRMWKVATRLALWPGSSLGLALGLGLGLGLVVASPAAAETIHMTGTFPARARALVGTQRLAIDRFGGDGGGLLAAAIAQRLEAPDGGGPPHFTLVGPGDAADVVLAGSVSTDVDHDDYDEERSRCAEKKDGKCVRRDHYRVRCTRRTIEVTAAVRAVPVPADGRGAYAATKPRSDTTSWCEDEGDPASVGSTVEGMISSIAYEVRTDLAPHTARYGVRIREGREGMPRGLADRFKAAVRLTNHDEQGGCAAFRELAAEAPDHPSIAFNVALCTEAAGDYARAAGLYRAVRLHVPKHGGDIDAGIERVGMLMTAQGDAAAGRPRPADPL